MRDVLASSPDICPGQISWDYDCAEVIADGVVHAIGVCPGLIGATIVVIAVNIERIEIAPILAYVIGLVTMLALSAAYNMCLARQVGSAPLRPLRDLSIDRYTPFLAQMKNVLASAGLGSRALTYLQLVFEDMSMTSPTWRAVGQVVLVYFAVGGAAVTAQDTQPGRATFAEMIALPDLLPSPASV